MRRTAAIVAAFAAGVVAGAALLLALPVPGVPDSPGGPSLRKDAVVGEAPVPTLLAWTPGRLPDGYAEAVRGLGTVRTATVVRSGVAWMDRWRVEPGRTERPPEGLRVPVEIASIHRRSYAAFVPPADRTVVIGLQGAIVGQTFAELHGLDPGGEVVIAGTPLEVEAVLVDELVGAHEVVVAGAVGRRLGVERPRYLLIAPRPGSPAGRVEAGLRRAVPAGVRVRIRAPGETPVFRHGDAVLPQARVKELFGEFAAAPRPDGTLAVEPAWVRANVRTARVPILGEIRCHRLVVPLVRGPWTTWPRATWGTSWIPPTTAAATTRGSSPGTPEPACPTTPGGSPSTSTCPRASPAGSRPSTPAWSRRSSHRASSGAGSS